MNALILVAALAGGQCDATTGVCEVTVQAIVVSQPTLAKRCGPVCRRIAPVRRTLRALGAVRAQKPLRTWFRTKRPVRRVVGRVLCLRH